MEFAAGRLGVAQERLRARQRLTAFQAGNRRLTGAHPSRELGLREART
jgi:hypothetical protein